ncbi:MAG TPA: GNAT family N-acetyltransferase [Thermoanaerobaculia bacterium]|nr:GNAT family N-acetyltransferase [Thermoanaerobaculia bacterium]
MSSAEPQPKIRLYEPRDRAAVHEICRTTAYDGDGAALVDPQLFTDLMMRAWTDFGAGPLWVAEQEGRVQGYLAGCFDLPRFARLQTWRVVPPAVAGALARGLLLEPELWRLLARLPRFLAASREGPRLDRYPSDLHINLLPPAQGHELGSRMVELFLAEASRRGLPGAHAIVYEENEPARRFFESLGFEPLGRQPAFRPPPADGRMEWKIVYGRQI